MKSIQDQKIYVHIPVLIGNSKNFTLLNNVSLYVQESSVIKYVNKCEVRIMIFLSLIKVVWNEKSGYFSFVTMCLFTKMTTLVIWSLLG